MNLEFDFQMSFVLTMIVNRFRFDDTHHYISIKVHIKYYEQLMIHFFILNKFIFMIEFQCL